MPPTFKIVLAPLATSNVEVGLTIYPVNSGRVGKEGKKGARDNVTKRRGRNV